MAHGHYNGSSSGQVPRPVRWFFLQMMPSFTDANLPVSARKWTCKVCLRVSFERPQELNRHIQLMHLPCCVFCPYSRCEWRGCRVDELQKHLDQKQCNRNSADREYRIYDVQRILEMIRVAENNDSIKIAQDWALHYVQERAIQLGRNGWIVDPWGCSEQRERRDRRMSRR